MIYYIESLECLLNAFKNNQNNQLNSNIITNAVTVNYRSDKITLIVLYTVINDKTDCYGFFIRRVMQNNYCCKMKIKPTGHLAHGKSMNIEVYKRCVF